MKSSEIPELQKLWTERKEVVRTLDIRHDCMILDVRAIRGTPYETSAVSVWSMGLSRINKRVKQQILDSVRKRLQDIDARLLELGIDMEGD